MRPPLLIARRGVLSSTCGRFGNIFGKTPGVFVRYVRVISMPALGHILRLRNAKAGVYYIFKKLMGSARPNSRLPDSYAIWRRARRICAGGISLWRSPKRSHLGPPGRFLAIALFYSLQTVRLCARLNVSSQDPVRQMVRAVHQVGQTRRYRETRTANPGYQNGWTRC